MRPKWHENPAQMVSPMKRRNHGLRKPVQRRNHETYCTHEILKLNVGNAEGRRMDFVWKGAIFGPPSESSGPKMAPKIAQVAPKGPQKA